MDQPERWKGRHQGKDELRRQVWQALQDEGAAVGNPWSTIPSFEGAEEAAARLTELPAWQSAKVVKSNPDAAQAHVRLKALQEGKKVYTPIPELVKDMPFLLLNPVDLQERSISFESVMYSSGAMEHGKPVQFSEVEPIDFFVVGSVAVTRAGGRTGKGAGFADLELGIFEYYGVVSSGTPVVSTVHDLQLVADDQLVMQEHDNALNIIATPTQLITTGAAFRTPCPIDWGRVQPDQFENIPFLIDLRKKLTGS